MADDEPDEDDPLGELLAEAAVTFSVQAVLGSEEARPALERVLAEFDFYVASLEVEDRADALIAMGEVLHTEGLHDRAVNLFRRAVYCATDEEDRREGLQSLGTALLLSGRHDEAEAALRAAIAVGEATGADHDVAISRHALARLLSRRNPSAALLVLDEVWSWFEAAGLPAEVLVTLLDVVYCQYSLVRVEPARANLDLAWGLFRDCALGADFRAHLLFAEAVISAATWRAREDDERVRLIVLVEECAATLSVLSMPHQATLRAELAALIVVAWTEASALARKEARGWWLAEAAPFAHRLAETAGEWYLNAGDERGLDNACEILGAIKTWGFPPT